MRSVTELELCIRRCGKRDGAGRGGPQSRPATVPGSQCVNRSAQPRLFADSDLCLRGKGILKNQSGRFS